MTGLEWPQMGYRGRWPPDCGEPTGQTSGLQQSEPQWGSSREMTEQPSASFPDIKPAPYNQINLPKMPASLPVQEHSSWWVSWPASFNSFPLLFCFYLCFCFLTCIGVELIYKVVLVSAVQQN